MNPLQTLADDIVRRHAEWTVRWHETDTPPERDLPWVVVEQNHRMNFFLWHEEDVARCDDLGAERLGAWHRRSQRTGPGLDDIRRR